MTEDLVAIRDRLYEALLQRAPLVTERKRHYDGALTHPAVDKGSKEAVFARFQKQALGRFLGTAVECYVHRLRINSVRVNREHHAQLWDHITNAGVLTDAAKVHRDTLALGWGHLLVLPHLRLPGRVTTRALQPDTAITEPWDDDPAETRYALTVTRNRDDRIVRLYTPNSLAWWPITRKGDLPERIPKDVDGQMIHLKLPAVPVVAFGDGTSLLEPAVNYQRNANQSALHALAVERAQAFRRTWILAKQLERDPDTGDPIPPAVPQSPADVAALEGDPKIWESTPTLGADLDRSHDAQIQRLAGVTHVPVHYLLPTAGASIAGDVLARAEDAFTAALLHKTEAWEQSWSQVLHLIAAITDTPVDGVLRPGWDLRLPQPASLAGDASIKMVQAGLPLDVAAVESGLMTPGEAAHLDPQPTVHALTETLEAS